MSITEKLGKAGIPGFRSGKKWKMLLASIGYLFIFSFILIVALVPPPETTQTQSPTPTHTPAPTTTPTESIIVISDEDDIPPKTLVNYTNFTRLFSANNKPIPDKIIVNGTITAKLGTMVEITDKTDIGCIYVVDKVRGVKMPSGRYLMGFSCDFPLDTESTVVTITNPDEFQPVSYMIEITATEVK